MNLAGILFQSDQDIVRDIELLIDLLQDLKSLTRTVAENTAE